MERRAERTARQRKAIVDADTGPRVGTGSDDSARPNGQTRTPSGRSTLLGSSLGRRCSFGGSIDDDERRSSVVKESEPSLLARASIELPRLGARVGRAARRGGRSVEDVLPPGKFRCKRITAITQ
ncbi:hypothetical protein KM043_001778 [Ampulex compressa]|nr:hypothetical protein KM043_001778 [Ampulex compressa]